MRKIKRIIGIIGFLSFFMMIGTVGGMETGTMEFSSGVILSVVFVSIFGLSVSLHNHLDNIERSRQRHNTRLLYNKVESLEKREYLKGAA